MLTKFLVFLCDISPVLRRFLWRWWYGKLARQIATPDWTFMNYGLVPANSRHEQGPSLLPADVVDRYCIQLYEAVVGSVDLQGKNVLEVGSGRGGGASYVARYHKPFHVTGVDFSAETVAFCRQRHQLPNLEFRTGDAEKLPFDSNCFDAVINVESSHCYGHMDIFLREVVRVLRPGGYFLFADLRTAGDMVRLKEILQVQDGWEKLEEEEITDGVAAALEADDVRKRKLIIELVPEQLRPMFEEFAGVTGGKVYQGLRKKELQYFRFVFRKR